MRFLRRSTRTVSPTVVLAAVGAVLVAGLLIAGQVTRPDSIIAAPPLDAATVRQVLPSSGDAAMVIAIDPVSAQPAYVVGHVPGESAELALLEWDAAGGNYVVLSLLTLAREGRAVLSLSTVVVEPLSGGASLVIARGETDNGDGFALVVRDGSALRFADIVGSDGGSAPPIDSFIAAVDALDLDGDGSSELLILPSQGSASAFAWKNGAFVEDAELSRIADLRERLFPEPDR